MIIGITGGIACGKSVVAQLFEDTGFKRIDTDKIAHHILDTDADLQQALQERWGAKVLTPEGLANRKFIAKQVFHSPTELEWLEQHLHPKIRVAWTHRVEEDPQAHWVIEIPLLFEKNLENLFDICLTVVSDNQAQLARLESRGLSPEEAQARIARQLPTEAKQARADFVIHNNSTIPFLHQQVASIIEAIS